MNWGSHETHFSKLYKITRLGNCYVDDNDFISEHELAQAKFMRIPKKKDIADANEELYQMRKKYHQVGAGYYKNLSWV